MQLTQFTDFGLRVLMYLTEQNRETLVTITEIAEQFSIPRNHLVKVVNRLVKLNWVTAVRGRNGGLSLSVQPNELHLGNVIRQLENHCELVNCEKSPCSLQGQCYLKHIIDKELMHFFERMDQYTLADAVNRKTGIVIAKMHQSAHDEMF